MLLATTSDINPATLGAAVNDRAAQALRGVCEKLEAVARGEESTRRRCWRSNRSGAAIILRAYWLDDDNRSPQALIGVRIQRQEPMILRFVHAMGRLPLSPQQREIALLLARGASNQDIADNLGVSGNTVAYHIKQLFQKLDVHDRAGRRGAHRFGRRLAAPLASAVQRLSGLARRRWQELHRIGGAGAGAPSPAAARAEEIAARPPAPLPPRTRARGAG